MASQALEVPIGSIPSLTIVIPALNEEAAIGETISRCLDARESIKEAAGLSDVELIVVSDGSTDRTPEIAQSFEEVKVIVFLENRGYGAAIKEGWRQGKGTLLGFLDADGTCDPIAFASLCQVALEESADVVLGSRLGPDSKMPALRRVGNRLYAFLLGLLSGRRVTDTSSGMRVVTRKSLRFLYPLPDGLHFTPSMSARALMNGLRIIEVPMAYRDRVGKSKLSVVRDGFRFLKTILYALFYYRPESVFLAGFVLCGFVGILLALNPTEFYVANRRLEEWMIYRFVACSLLGIVGYSLLLATALLHSTSFFSSRRGEAVTFWSSMTAALLMPAALAFVLILLLGAMIFLLWPGIVEYATTGTVSLHWSRLLAGGFALLAAIQTSLFALLQKIVRIWGSEHQVSKRGEL